MPDWVDCADGDSRNVKLTIMDYHIKGGVNTVTGDVDWLEVHAGVVYLKGQVKTVVHTGGVIYDQRTSDHVEYRTDHISEEERSRYRRRIAELENRLSKSDAECLNLRKKLNSSSDRLLEDDVLVAKIEQLQRELAKERVDRKQDVDDLKERLSVAMEINAKLRCDTGRETVSQEIADRHVDILASLMALYPFTPDKDMELEFNIPAGRIREVARVLGVIKSPEARREAREYLQRQHIEFIQRRGGNQGNFPMSKPVEKISRNGRVIQTYDTITEAEEDTGHAAETIRNMCKAYDTKRKYTKEGYTFRFRDT